MMGVLKIAVFIVASIAICQANVIEWRKHTARVNSFTCSSPQPRSMSVTELIENDILLSARLVIPESTILHRCESAGCCPRNKTCSPQEIEDVKLVFYVSGGPKNKKYIEVTAKNHTSCVCDVFKDNPK